MPPLRKVKHRIRERRRMEKYEREEEARNALVRSIGEVLKEKHPRVYEEISFYFNTDAPGTMVQMSWEALAAIMFVTQEDTLEKDEFQ